MDYFNLNHDKDSAVVRILASGMDKIERGSVHRIPSEGRNRKVRCLGQDCPFCEAGVEKNDRLYVHLWDYTDNTEKVWDRTPNVNFLNSLSTVAEDWGGIGQVVLRITREGDDFPKYNITTLNPGSYAMPDESLYDKDSGYMCSTYRSADEMQKYLETGVLPEHKKREGTGTWLPREEWLKQRAQENGTPAQAPYRPSTPAPASASYKSTYATPAPLPVKEKTPIDIIPDDDDPFMDPFADLARV